MICLILLVYDSCIASRIVAATLEHFTATGCARGSLTHRCGWYDQLVGSLRLMHDVAHRTNNGQRRIVANDACRTLVVFASSSEASLNELLVANYLLKMRH